MKPPLRFFVLVGLLVVSLAAPAGAQYLRLTTDNPTDNTRMRASGTTVLTISLDTNHDKSGIAQTCNSHTAALCGNVTTPNALDIGAYTITLSAAGGMVTWGAYSSANPAYVDVGSSPSTSTQVEINFGRASGFDPPGLYTLGTIPVTPAVGSNPSIIFARGAQPINPFGFGTGFGTECDAFNFPNTYVLADPADLCNTGDFTDADGVLAAAGPNTPPSLAPIANMNVNVGGCAGSTADQAISATDPDGDAITFTSSGPPWMTVTSNAQVGNTRTGNIHLAPPPNTTPGTFPASVTATANNQSDTKSFTITTPVVNQGPVLNQPANMTVTEGTTADQTITGSDPCGAPLTFVKVGGPTFMSVTTVNGTTGTIHLAPGTTDAGTYSATVRASNGSVFNDKSLTITVRDSNRAPTLNPIANMTTFEGGGCRDDQTISGSDPDGDALTFTKTAGPTFMTVTTTSPTTGNIHIQAGFADGGAYSATVSASDGSLSDSKSFFITVNSANRAPTLVQPSDMSVVQGATADQTITGSDPDGCAVFFSKVSGPTYMTVTTTSSGNGTGTGNIHLAPTFTDLGTARATVRASDGAITNEKSFLITILSCNCGATLNQPANMTVTEGMTADQVITASDPFGSPITFSKVSGPIFMTVSTINVGTGNVHLAPGLADAGTYAAFVRATNGSGLFDTKSFTITVLTSGNQCPTADPGGPYSGLVSVAVNFNGSASSDPDGNPLTYAWDFDASDGIQVDAVGVLASHAYAAPGNFTVTLTVTDNGDTDPAQVCSRSATTVATIRAACDATIFNGYDTIRLGSGKPYWFAYIQPADACYANTDVIVSSFVMKYAGRQVLVSANKTTVGGDKSGDGIQEIKVSFTKDDLRTLFAGTGLPNGHNTVTVVLEARLVTGGILRGTTQLDVVNNGSFTISAVAPNPLNPSAVLTYTTTRKGAVRIDMFDIQGRLVRRLVDDPALEAGVHETKIDGLGQRGEKLPSGVYYIRGVSAEGRFQHLVTILK